MACMGRSGTTCEGVGSALHHVGSGDQTHSRHGSECLYPVSHSAGPRQDTVGGWLCALYIQMLIPVPRDLITLALS